jgi:hypothetical protein
MTSGSSRVFSDRSMAATAAREASEIIGTEYTRTATSSHTGHGSRSPAAPTGRLICTTPCRAQRYS